ncbi:MAG: hypothetical protein K5840_02195 [Eubacterium sp.]|nr:hypothetical protein [Eubacterium sp.]
MQKTTRSTIISARISRAVTHGKEKTHTASNVILNGYHLIRRLSGSQMSCVFIARHIASEQLCIIKRVSKAHPLFNQLCREEMILRSLYNPYVPELYQTFRDEEYFYLAEEYIDGISLGEYHRLCGITASTCVDVGIELCQMISLLHDQNPKPILYLDFKPEHFLIHGGGLRMIDLGSALFEGEKAIGRLAFTPGFAPPEAAAGSVPDKRWDVYGICALLGYLLHSGATALPADAVKIPKDAPAGLAKILAGGLSRNPGRRQRNAKILGDQLLSLKQSVNIGTRNLRKIAVISSRPGAGATHIAISLTVFLNGTGRRAVYVPPSATAFSGLGNMKGIRKVDELCEFLGFRATHRGDYEPAEGETAVYDIGTSYGDFFDVCTDADMVLGVCSPGRWDEEETGRMLIALHGFGLKNGKGKSTPRSICVLNRTTPTAAGGFCRHHRTSAALFPLSPDPFQRSRAVSDFFAAIFRETHGL